MPTGEFYIIYRLKKDQHPKATLNSYIKKSKLYPEKKWQHKIRVKTNEIAKGEIIRKKITKSKAGVFERIVKSLNL